MCEGMSVYTLTDGDEVLDGVLYEESVLHEELVRFREFELDRLEEVAKHRGKLTQAHYRMSWRHPAQKALLFQRQGRNEVLCCNMSSSCCLTKGGFQQGLVDSIIYVRLYRERCEFCVRAGAQPRELAG